MNLRQTAEVATLVATSASHIVERSDSLSTPLLHGYWKQSRTRLKCWFAGLRAAQIHATTVPPRERPELLVPLCREILVTELLTRVWSTVLVAHDKHRQSDQARSTVENVFRGHQEARHEVLQLLADDEALSPADQISLDRFRRRMERWTDALIGPLAGAYGVTEFAFDQQRARDFADESLQGALQASAAGVMPLLLAGITAALPRQMDADQERAILNLAIVRTILAAFPEEAFGDNGQLRRRDPGKVRPGAASHAVRAHLPGLSFAELRRRRERQQESGD